MVPALTGGGLVPLAYPLRGASDGRSTNAPLRVQSAALERLLAHRTVSPLAGDFGPALVPAW
jgi:hypothetical protein